MNQARKQTERIFQNKLKHYFRRTQNQILKQDISAGD